MGLVGSGKRATVKFLTSILKNKDASFEQKLAAAELWVQIEKMKLKKTRGKSKKVVKPKISDLLG